MAVRDRREHGLLSIRSERRSNELYVVELFGEFDLAGAEMAAGVLARVSESDADEIVVDLSGLDFIDASGLGVLCEASARSGGRFRLRQGHGLVNRVLELAGLAETLDFTAQAARRLTGRTRVDMTQSHVGLSTPSSSRATRNEEGGDSD